jgi:hypothetical protein
MVNRYLFTIPSLIQGVRCYIDAFTTPDQHPQTMKSAGLGVFIVNTEAQPTQTVYIKATLQECSSVLMAEAAGLALAVQITQLMELTNIRLPALMDLYIHPLYVLVSKILSSILNSPALIHHLYHPLSTLSTVGPTCYFI